MKLLRLLARELVGLFIDDEFLAVAILVVVAATTVLREGTHADPLIAAAVLLGGCLAVLLASVHRGARRRS